MLVGVFLSNSRPRYLASEGPETGVYVRLGFTNRQADRELIAELRRSVEGVFFDEMPLPQLSVADLDLDAARRAFAGERELNERELLTLKLLVRDWTLFEKDIAPERRFATRSGGLQPPTSGWKGGRQVHGYSPGSS